MARGRKFGLGLIGVAVLSVVAALTFWVGPSRQTSSAQDAISPAGPLISRGYTDAPTGTVSLSGDPSGGALLTELRVAEGQKVKRDEVIAVLSNYSSSDVTVRITEAELEKFKYQRESMTTGFRVAEIAMQDIVVKTKAEEFRLKSLELARSGKTPDIKQIELTISQQDLLKEQAKLRMMKETLEADRAQTDIDLKITGAKLDNALTARERALVRSPVDGVIVQIYTRQGERAAGGIVKIVDMSQLRVLADVDEVHLGRVVAGGKVEVVFRGSTTIYRGKVYRIASTVKRMQRTEPDGGSSTDARVVQVEIELDDPNAMPQVMGRETRVTFL